MPFDSMPLILEPSARAARMFDLIRQRFWSREWDWIQGALTDHKKGYCLLGAVDALSHECPTDAIFAQRYLFEAIIGKRWRNPERAKCVITIGRFNDHHSFDDVMDALATAQRLAEADVLPW